MRTRLRVKEVAVEKKMSMTRLHQRSEVAYGTIRKIFRDPYTDITLTTLNRLAQTLGVSSRDLLEDVSDEEAAHEQSKVSLNIEADDEEL